MKFKKGDIIILIILAVSIVSWGVVSFVNRSTGKELLVIQVEGSIHRTVALNSLKEAEQVHIDLGGGGYVDVHMDSEGAFVEQVTCPDKLCKKTGRINRAGQSIVCLPNRIVIYIEGKSPDEVDGVSY